MSILIRNMEMPPNCSECAFCGYYGNKMHLCDINQQEIDYEAMLENRRDDCPLVPVPPHGRLIDADALEPDTDWLYDDDGFTAFSKLAIECAPTIIPAEEGE